MPEAERPVKGERGKRRKWVANAFGELETRDGLVVSTLDGRRDKIEPAKMVASETILRQTCSRTWFDPCD